LFGIDFLSRLPANTVATVASRLPDFLIEISDNKRGSQIAFIFALIQVYAVSMQKYKCDVSHLFPRLKTISTRRPEEEVREIANGMFETFRSQ